MEGHNVPELQLDDIDSELFQVGLDYKVAYDDEMQEHYIIVLGGEQHINLITLWEAGVGSEESETFFFDSDDIRATLYINGIEECSVDLFPESASELVSLIEKIFSEGVDSLE